MVADLRRLVECESPSADLTAVAHSAEVVADVGSRLLGADPEAIVLDGRTHLRWRFGDGPGVLLLGHHDTVWPLGSLERHPWRFDGDRIEGPGCFDMKAGLVQLFHAVAAGGWVAAGAPVTVLVTGDEELGAPSSRTLIEDEACRARAALVLEGSADGGALKTARKGVAMYVLTAHGRAAHAGLEPWNGVNAAVELAAQVLALIGLDRGPDGATVTPGVMAAGTTTNTVPATGTVTIDCRVPSMAEFERVNAGLRALTPHLNGAQLTLDGGLRHPPMEPEFSAALYRMATAVCRDLGLPEPASARVGGASDGNLTAGAGTPTLDGLGAVGGNPHAPGEHVLASTMEPRARMLSGLVARILAAS
nr:M20 family metallopeptidase [Kribbella solani]